MSEDDLAAFRRGYAAATRDTQQRIDRLEFRLNEVTTLFRALCLDASLFLVAHRFEASTFRARLTATLERSVAAMERAA
jgi:hypothetical protein